MSDKSNKTQSPPQQATEIIELAIDDIELLTRAFDMISTICSEANSPAPQLDSTPPQRMVH